MKKLLVLVINDMVIFPNNEVRIEYDNNYDKQMVDIVDLIDDNLMIIVNPIDEEDINITSFPKYGVLGRLKLKMNVPNGKTRIVIEGIERIELSSIVWRFLLLSAMRQRLSNISPSFFLSSEKRIA